MGWGSRQVVAGVPTAGFPSRIARRAAILDAAAAPREGVNAPALPPRRGTMEETPCSEVQSGAEQPPIARRADARIARRTASTRVGWGSSEVVAGLRTA